METMVRNRIGVLLAVLLSATDLQVHISCCDILEVYDTIAIPGIWDHRPNTVCHVEFEQRSHKLFVKQLNISLTRSRFQRVQAVGSL